MIVRWTKYSAAPPRRLKPNLQLLHLWTFFIRFERRSPRQLYLRVFFFFFIIFFARWIVVFFSLTFLRIKFFTKSPKQTKQQTNKKQNKTQIIVKILLFFFKRAVPTQWCTILKVVFLTWVISHNAGWRANTNLLPALNTDFPSLIFAYYVDRVKF